MPTIKQNVVFFVPHPLQYAEGDVVEESDYQLIIATHADNAIYFEEQPTPYVADASSDKKKSNSDAE